MTRRPAQERPKRRGSGTTTSPAEATLERLEAEDAPRVVATGWRDVTDAVKDRLGFDSAQFRQVVVLPQGRFREVLTADSRTREAILRTLFRTDRQEAIQAALKTRAAALARDLERLGTERETLCGQAAALVEVESVADAAALRARLKALDEDCTRLGQEEREAAAAEKAAVEAHEAAKRAGERLREAARSAEALGVVEAKAPGVAETRERLRRARSAAPVGEVAAAALRADARRETTTRQAAETVEAAKKAVAAKDAAERAWGEVSGEEARGAREAARAEVQRLQALKPKVTERGVLQARVAKGDAVLADARRVEVRAKDAHETARAVLQALRRAWEEGQAGVLARVLSPGRPCPVCGATEHPAPAHAPEDVPTEEALRQAEQREASALRDRDAAARRAEKHARALADLRAQLEVRERDLAGVDLGTGALEEALAAATRRRDDLLAAETRARGALATAREDAARSETARRAAEDAAVEAAAEATRRREAFAAALAEAGFESREAFEEARATEERIAAMDRDVQAFADQRAAARDRAARAAKAAEGVEPPDLDARLEARERAERALADLRRRTGTLSQRRTSAGSLYERLARAEAEAGEKERRYGVVGRLAELAVGTNAKRLSFQRFVLAALLDEVLEVASRRLASMTRGRYRLRRRREGEDLRRLAGLDLDVEDAWTNTERHASTLSGGEGFQAALALALGLADVVQRHAGGIRLDALFVDEGFGSLDPDALDLALATLFSLREGGRLVGIVSHVPELAERIDVRLEVRGGPDGSTARLVLP